MCIIDWSSDVCASDLWPNSGIGQQFPSRDGPARRLWKWSCGPPFVGPARPSAIAPESKLSRLTFAAAPPIKGAKLDALTFGGTNSPRSAKRGFFVALSPRGATPHATDESDRKSVVWGKRVAVRVDIGGRRNR